MTANLRMKASTSLEHFINILITLSQCVPPNVLAPLVRQPMALLTAALLKVDHRHHLHHYLPTSRLMGMNWSWQIVANLVVEGVVGVAMLEAGKGGAVRIL